MFDLILKATSVILRTSLAVISSSKLVLACTIIEGSNIIDENKRAAGIYLGLSLIALVAVSYIYLLRQRRGLAAIFLSFIIVLSHPAWRFGGGSGDCGESYAELSKWLFGLSLLCLLYQTAIYVRGKKTS